MQEVMQEAEKRNKPPKKKKKTEKLSCHRKV
jgi:hypothetical protein